jgi:hypothetical protein
MRDDICLYLKALSINNEEMRDNGDFVKPVLNQYAIDGSLNILGVTQFKKKTDKPQ